MAADRNDTPAKSEMMKSHSPTLLKAPAYLQETPWILHSLNQMQSKIDRLEHRLEQGMDSLDNRLQCLDNRLRRLERLAYIVIGSIFTVGAILELLSIFDVTITPKP